MTLTRLVDPREGDEGLEGQEIHRQVAERAIRELGAAGTPTGEPNPKAVLAFSQWITGYCFSELKSGAPAGWSLEVELALAFEFARFILSGHIDACAINPDATEAVGWDYKTGSDSVDVSELNEQVLTYIVLLTLAYPSLRRITFYIVQPRNDEDEGFPRVSQVVVEGERLLACRNVLEARINAALDNPMEINTGRKQCKWCPAHVSCPGIDAEIDFMKMTLTPEMLAGIRRTPDDDRLGRFVISARTVSKPIEDATDLLKERIEAQGYVDAGGTRITIKESPGHYEYPNPPAFYAELLRMFPDPVKRAGALKFSVTNTKDLIADVYGVPKTGRAAATAQSMFDAAFRPLVEQKTKKILVFH